MTQTLKLFLVGSVLTIALDFVWLGLLMSNYYREKLQSVVKLTPDGRMDPNYLAASVVYLLIPAGIIAFVLPQDGVEASIVSIALRGLAFGAVLYGVYEFTNYSTLRDWPFSLVWIDTLWGAFLCGAVSAAMALLRK
jgi:uncharacterized membrane protein